MRRRLIILGILAGVAVIAVAVVLLSRSGGLGNQTSSACQDMLISLRNDDIDGSYNLLSDSAKEIVTREDWQEEAELYGFLLEGGVETPWFISSETQEATESDPLESTVERYRVDSSGGEWDGLCTFFQSGGLIDSFVLVEAGRTP